MTTQEAVRVTCKHGGFPASYPVWLYCDYGPAVVVVSVCPDCLRQAMENARVVSMDGYRDAMRAAAAAQQPVAFKYHAGQELLEDHGSFCCVMRIEATAVMDRNGTPSPVYRFKGATTWRPEEYVDAKFGPFVIK